MGTQDLRRGKVPERSGWRVRLYPGAGEAVGAFWSEVGTGSRGRGEAPDGEAAMESATRRARGQVRRYCAEHGLNRLGTLTYGGEGQHDPVQLRRDVAAFFRSIRREVGGRLPYLWVPEWHKSGHGLHVHFALGQFVDRSRIVRSWPHGFVHIKLLGDVPTGAGRRGEARQAARYLAKYVGKDTGEARAGGLHRYEVAQGFRPPECVIRARSAEDAIAQATEMMGHEPEYVWRSRDQEGWSGPPAVFASWR